MRRVGKLRRFSLASLIAGVLVVAAGAASGANLHATLDRSTMDRADEVSGAQVHLVYAVASDGADRQRDVDGTVADTAAVFQAWLAAETEGQALRIDTYQREPDVTFVRLAETDSALANRRTVDALQMIQQNLARVGLNRPDKVYSVFYDGAKLGEFCGYGYLGFAMVSSGCAPPDLLLLHETLHGLGMVPSCAPHFDGTGHVNDDPLDLMHADVSAASTALDAGRDDYFRTNIPGCPDLADSPYLANNYAKLTVSVSGEGEVKVGEQTCTESTCTYWLPTGAAVNLGAQAVPGRSRFRGWSGACSSGGNCRITLTSSASVTATFARVYSLNVRVIGSGSVRLSGGRKACARKSCSYGGLAAGTRIVLTPVPARGYRFVRWRGCTGRRACTTTVRANTTITAVFAKRT